MWLVSFGVLLFNLPWTPVLPPVSHQLTRCAVIPRALSGIWPGDIISAATTSPLGLTASLAAETWIPTGVPSETWLPLPFPFLEIRSPQKAPFALAGERGCHCGGTHCIFQSPGGRESSGKRGRARCTMAMAELCRWGREGAGTHFICRDREECPGNTADWNGLGCTGKPVKGFATVPSCWGGITAFAWLCVQGELKSWSEEPTVNMSPVTGEKKCRPSLWLWVWEGGKLWPVGRGLWIALGHARPHGRCSAAWVTLI